jgi:hypothetical protein
MLTRKEELYSENSAQLASYLSPTIVNLSRKLPQIYLTGDEISQLALYCKGIVTQPSIQQSSRKYSGYLFFPNLDTFSGFQYAIEEKRRFEISTIGAAQPLEFPRGMDLYYQSKIINNDTQSVITWIKTSREKLLHCSAQCLYHPRTKRIFWKNKHHHDLFIQKILLFSEWDNLFYTLNWAIGENNHRLRIYVENEINFLFRLYVKHLAQGWTLDPSDRQTLEFWFNNDSWNRFFNDSHYVYMQRKANKEALDSGHTITCLPPIQKIDLMQALGLQTTVATLVNNEKEQEEKQDDAHNDKHEIKISNDAPLHETLIPEEDVEEEEEEEQEEEEEEQEEEEQEEEEEEKYSETLNITIEEDLYHTEDLDHADEQEQDEDYIFVRKHKAIPNEDIGLIFEKSQRDYEKNKKVIRAVEKQKFFQEKDKEKSINQPSKSKASENAASSSPPKKKKPKKNQARKHGSSHNDNDVDEFEDREADEKQASFLWNELTRLKNWVCKHPFMAVMGTFTLGAILIELASKQSAETTWKSECLNNYRPVYGNANFTDAQFLVLLDRADNPKALPCIEEFNPKRILHQDIPLGQKFVCGKRDCIGADSISIDRAIFEKNKIFENIAYMNMKRIHEKHNGIDLGGYYQYLKIFQSNISGKKIELEKLFKFSEKNIDSNIDYDNIPAQDEYRQIIIMRRHIKFLLNQITSKAVNNINALFKKYERDFLPKDEQYTLSPEEIESRTNALNQALLDHVPIEDKVILFARKEFFLPYYQKYLSPEKVAACSAAIEQKHPYLVVEPK